MATKSEILQEIHRIAIICCESGFNTLGACPLFLAASAVMNKERQAADLLAPISQEAADEEKAMTGGIN